MTKCTSSAQCVSAQQCEAGSCGRRMKGATCAQGSDCVSGFCANGVCCNAACNGPCLSCRLPNREGTCWPVDQGVPDPNGICRSAGAASCGQTGLCDGVGSCARFARDTPCTVASCAGNKLNTPGTCNGLGVCGAPGIETCHPFACADGACATSCKTDDDCDDGIACLNEHLRSEARRSAVRQGERVPVGLLRRRPVLRERLHRRVLELRAGVVAGPLHAGGRRQPRPARDVRGAAGVDVRHQRPV